MLRSISFLTTAALSIFMLAGCGDFTGIGNSPHTSQSSWEESNKNAPRWSTDEHGPGPAAAWTTASSSDDACRVRSRTYAIGEMTSTRYRVEGSFDLRDETYPANAVRFTLLADGVELASFAVVR